MIALISRSAHLSPTCTILRDTISASTPSSTTSSQTSASYEGLTQHLAPDLTWIFAAQRLGNSNYPRSAPYTENQPSQLHRTSTTLSPWWCAYRAQNSTVAEKPYDVCGCRGFGIRNLGAQALGISRRNCARKRWDNLYLCTPAHLRGRLKSTTRHLDESTFSFLAWHAWLIVFGSNGPAGPMCIAGRIGLHVLLLPINELFSNTPKSIVLVFLRHGMAKAF